MHWTRATLVFLFGFALSQPAFAGFQEGFDAFRQNDFLTAMAEFLPIAERGDSGAAILVGILYANGYGLDGPEMDQAAHWFNAAADAGDCRPPLHGCLDDPAAHLRLCRLDAFGDHAAAAA